MSLEDKFDNLSVRDDHHSGEHVNTRILDKFANQIKTDELSFTRGKTNKDKANRATVENVLDPRTMRFLQALTSRGVISDFNGCISTGKEANVYHAFAGYKQHGKTSDTVNEDDGTEHVTKDGDESVPEKGDESVPEKRDEYAIKIFKTSILVFKDRERYVDGEFRFRKSRSQHNPRKMIKIWAEKEYRNLKRIYQSGVIPVPKPIEIKNNVLVMEFLNRGNGFASPRLRDYPYKDRDEIYYFYYNMIADIRLLYQVCRLVHADLSEYNSLVHNGQLYIIDVSQSVQPEHPMSLDFLRMDIKNVNLYFEKMGIDIFPERLIFQFTISETLPNFSGDMKNLGDLMKYISTNLEVKKTAEDEAEDEVFRSLYLVRNLNGLEERDFDRFTEGKFDLLKSLLAHDNEKNFSNQNTDELDAPLDGNDSDDDDTDDDELDDEITDEEDGSSEEEEYSDEEPKVLKGKKYEDKDEKKARKQEAKDAKREKRKTKVKKHIKKKLLKKTKSKK